MKKSKVIFLALLACAFGASARTVTLVEAQNAARAWVYRGKTLGARFPSDVAERTVEHTTTNGATFYTVKMASGGTVFMSGDTEVQPVICFTSDTGDFSTIDRKSPLWALLNKDVSSRQSATKPLLVLATSAAAAQQSALGENERAWAKLIDEGEELAARTRFVLSAAALSAEPGDLRVDKIVEATWDQGDAGGGYHQSDDSTCYSYYTPQDASGNIVESSKKNAICGCVATAMSQIMFTQKFPESAVAGVYDNCWYDTTEVDLPVSGETYAWDTMEASPQATASAEVRKAIGLLTADAGRSVGMHYTYNDSGSFTFKARKAMTDVFKYAEAAFVGAEVPIKGAAAMGKILFANFDAGYPVMLGISGAGGHEIVGDGYGYQEDVPYVHLNMGWSGQDNLWYNLPLIGAFSSVDDAVYNIFKDKSNCGIISGRVTNDDGEGFGGVEVTISNGGEDIKVTTSESGVWAALVANGSYDVSFRDPVNGWYDALESPVEVTAPVETTKHFRWVTPLYKTTGKTEEGDYPAAKSLEAVGNSWGNDIVLAEPTVRIVVGTETNFYASLDKALNAASDGDNVEIIKSTVLKKTTPVAVNCTIAATNDDPLASAILRRDGAQVEIADGATVSVSNIAFDVANETTVVVSTGGVLRVGGYCKLGTVEAAASNNLVVASELACSFWVDSRDAFMLGNVFACGADGLDYLTASNCANRLLHYANTRWGGEAVMQGGKVVFRWSTGASVPDDAAVAKLIVNGMSRNYRSVDDVFEDIEGTAGTSELVVVKDSAFTRYYNIGADCHLFMHGLDDVSPVLFPSSSAGFAVVTNGSMMISNLVFSGYVDANAKDDHGFMNVCGGSLTLECDAVLSNMTGCVNNKSGVVDLNSGEMTMRPRSAIIGCEARGGSNGTGHGGAIYAAAASCSLKLEGGTISNCVAATYGGGIFVEVYGGTPTTVEISGPLVISGNRSNNNAIDNLYLRGARALSWFTLVGQLGDDNGGKVGIRYYGSGEGSGNALDDTFINSAVEAPTAETLETLVNDTDRKGVMLAAPNAANDGLMWATKPSDGQCWPENAKAHLIDAAGKVRYYDSVGRAIDYIGTISPCVVEMVTNDALSASCAIPADCDVTLRSAAGRSFTLRRKGDFGLTVPTGAMLTLTNVCISGKGDVAAKRSTAFLDVAGGELEMQAESTVCFVAGAGSRSANAITVYNGGTFTMNDGALIENCTNAYCDVDYAASPGVGGGVLVDGWCDKDSKSVVYLRGGTIRNCFALRGSAVYVCNKAEVHVSGAMSVEIDEPDHFNDFVVEDSSTLYLDDAVTGIFNMADGANGPAHDANFIGRVSWSWAGDVDALTNSAAKFVHSVSGERGAAATNVNDKTDTVLVWCGAVSGGQLYTNRVDGKVYASVADVGGLTPPPPLFTPLPELSSSAGADAVATALADSYLADSSVAENVTTLAEYNAFRDWANDVGVDDVVASDYAYRSYEFGTDPLLENEPEVEITEVSNVAGGLTVSVIVKDGEDPVAVAADKVAEMFEATSDVGDWSQNVELTVSDAKLNEDKSISFTVVPEGNPSTTFIRLKY